MSECTQNSILEVMQGHAFDFTLDATQLGDTEAFEAHVYASNTVVQKFRYPETAGFAALTKNGYIYDGVLTSAMTNLMLGVYGIVTIGVVAVGENKSGFAPEFVKVIQKPV